GGRRPRQRGNRQEALRERRLLSVPRLRVAGIERDRPTPRSSSDCVRRVQSLRASAHRSDAAVHGEGGVRCGSREHLRVRPVAAGTGEGHSITQAMTGTVRLKPDTTTEDPITRQQWLVAITCGLIVFVDGFDAQAMGYVAPALSEALQIPRSVLGPVISSGLVGMMIGALVSGSLADRIGRRPVLIGCALVFGIGSLLTA